MKKKKNDNVWWVFCFVGARGRVCFGCDKNLPESIFHQKIFFLNVFFCQDRRRFDGREIAVMFAQDRRKAPDEMRKRDE